jgi:hypothetical protein
LGDKVSRADLRNMAPEEVAQLHRSGDLDHLMRQESNDDRVARWQAEAREAQAGEPAPPAGNADQGSRGTQPKTGRDRLRGMTAEQIVAARRSGELDDLLG